MFLFYYLVKCQILWLYLVTFPVFVAPASPINCLLHPDWFYLRLLTFPVSCLSFPVSPTLVFCSVCLFFFLLCISIWILLFLYLPFSWADLISITPLEPLFLYKYRSTEPTLSVVSALGSRNLALSVSHTNGDVCCTTAKQQSLTAQRGRCAFS